MLLYRSFRSFVAFAVISSCAAFASSAVIQSVGRSVAMGVCVFSIAYVEYVQYRKTIFMVLSLFFCFSMLPSSDVQAQYVLFIFLFQCRFLLLF